MAASVNILLTFQYWKMSPIIKVFIKGTLVLWGTIALFGLISELTQKPNQYEKVYPDPVIITSTDSTPAPIGFSEKDLDLGVYDTIATYIDENQEEVYEYAPN